MNTTTRRAFIQNTGLISAGLALGARSLPSYAATQTALSTTADWEKFRQLFPLDFNYAHFANFLVTSHCAPIRAAIEAHRERLDRNPALVLDYDREEVWQHEHEVRVQAARYLNVAPGQIALTGSTTEGLSIVYGGLKLKPGQEILTTVHEHYSTRYALQYRTQRDGSLVRKISLFKSPRQASEDEILDVISRSIRPETRVLGMTWVHSGSGVKLPIGKIGELVKEKNKDRAEQDRIIYCVDGVHGFGVENLSFPEMNCDFFISGTHKWMFGPRGTGIICAASENTTDLIPFSATFSEAKNFATTFTPGGYHSFEYRWAASKAFELHLQLGKANVQQRIHELNSYLKQQLISIKGVELVTPQSSTLSAGFTFFRMAGLDDEALATYLNQNRIIVDSVSRDAGPVVRMAPGLLNTEAEVDRAIQLIAKKA
ncbi:aminotransferase class V-fold PLP-dependent enzyme [Pseudomonas sp. 3A(2025)]